MRYGLAIVKHTETNQKTEELRSINVSWVDKLEKKIGFDRFSVIQGSRSMLGYVFL